MKSEASWPITVDTFLASGYSEGYVATQEYNSTFSNKAY